MLLAAARRWALSGSCAANADELWLLQVRTHLELKVAFRSWSPPTSMMGRSRWMVRPPVHSLSHPKILTLASYILYLFGQKSVFVMLGLSFMASEFNSMGLHLALRV